MRNFQIFIIFAFFLSMSAAAHSQEVVKKPNVSGQFYPSDPKELSKKLDVFFSQAKIEPPKERVEVIISPHAGYVYSGSIAAYGYKAASQFQYSTVVVIAPSHQVSFPGVSIWPEGSFETPLGSLVVDVDFAKKLTAQNKEFSFVRAAFAKEHSLEVQLPFLQKTFSNFKIVPVVIGDEKFEVAEALAKSLEQVIGRRDDVLIVISTDMSHYHNVKIARSMDQQTIDLVRNLKARELWQGCSRRTLELCGFMPVATALLYAKEKGFTAEILKYADSSDASGDKEAVVGYFSAIFFKGNVKGKAEVSADSTISLSSVQKKRLLEIARQTIVEYVKNGKVLNFKETDPRLLLEEGAFVTLHEDGQLRGCIGNILGQGPLSLTVRDMAIAASTEDPRFRPVSKDELDKLEIEISVLSKPWKIKDTREVEPGVHGVIVSRGARKGLFLPQVATEQGWDREGLLTYLCAEKAGLAPNAWKDPSTIIEVFTAQVFSEKEF